MLEQRKSEHIRISLEEDVNFKGLTTGLERYQFRHNALPELNLAEIDTTVRLFGRLLQVPLLISSMTGGTDQAELINRRLAEAVGARGIAIGVGSQRVAIENPALAESFHIRPYAPDALIFANLGAVQLNYGYGLEHCQRAVDMIEADALILHFNPLQEAVQPEGDTDFSDLYAKVEALCRALPAPVIAKEVGWGFSEENARRLAQCGVAAIDVAGSGGTSWSQVEMYRAPTQSRRRIAATFIDWGIPTAEAILNVKRGAPALPVIASGGLRNGLDLAKCVGLGAHLGGMAGPFLETAVQSTEAAIEIIDIIHAELKIAMFAAGIPDVAALRDTPKLRKTGD
ncbi:MAG TPA: type 2 isopentenyl-diphosphate Delta-isomerase [Chloroflexi bacterium]|nr:type 2 isopentenyl-diphosphate Delta-isomerase [Chloroflexota bacterium]